MKSTILSLVLAGLPSTYAWGALGHETVAYVASNFVSDATKTYCQNILSDTSSSYLASVAAWADSYRETSAGRFSEPFHFIDAKDSPPQECNVDYSRDCKSIGCVVSAINNYTARVQDTSLPANEQFEALKFIIHFIGDIHQPLHDENILRGGNSVHVTYGKLKTNLHAVWDTSIPQAIAGKNTLPHAETWGTKLSTAITSGAYAGDASSWLANIDLSDPVTSAMGWAQGANAYVCSVVMPDGVDALTGTDLEGAYTDTAEPVIEMLIAQAGYRLAAWLNLLATGETGLGGESKARERQRQEL